MSPFRQKYMGFYSFATPKWFKFFVKYLVILCETLYNMYAVGCSVSAQGEPRGAKASGDRSHVTMIAGIGLVQMWHQRASHSLPPPLSLPAFLCLSPPLSLSISVPLCFFFFFPPLLCLSSASPPLRDGVCRCCSGIRGLTCTRRGPPSPDLLRILRVSPLAVSSTTTAAVASQLSPHPTSLCGCLGVGPLGVEGINIVLHWGAVQN